MTAFPKLILTILTMTILTVTVCIKVHWSKFRLMFREVIIGNGAVRRACVKVDGSNFRLVEYRTEGPCFRVNGQRM